MNTHNTRVIARLDIKGPNVVKGIHLEGLRIVGNPGALARKYYEAGADELLYMDIVASLYGRNNLTHIIEETAKDIFIPLTVGGGVRKLEDIVTLLRAGADKVAINTAAIKRPELLKEASRAFGSQCIVLSIEAKRQAPGKWEAYTDNGRERTGVDAVQWALRAAELGAGEILLTSIDQEGTQNGFDTDLVSKIARKVPIPVIVGGGAGKLEDFSAVVAEGADAVSAAYVFHRDVLSIKAVKGALAEGGAMVRA
ncbi:MAG: imidazole glycerol phosphate synthase subunit HisF [Elusimicrobia bacterium]|nr:imidazole glycerol phosphate synthase subunit HisF [Elusimicrobiota bacterium]